MAMILVVEDEQDTRVLLNEILSKELGHDVVFATDGASGLDRYRETLPDLVITDLVMPGLHGIPMIEHLREVHPDSRIIAISGRAPEQLDRARAAGARATLVKPIQRGELITAIEEALADPDPWKPRTVVAPDPSSGPAGGILRSPMVRPMDEPDDAIRKGLAGRGVPMDSSPEPRFPDRDLGSLGGSGEDSSEGQDDRVEPTSRLVDLSHVVEDGDGHHEGLPAPVVCDYLSHVQSPEHHDEGTELHFGEIRMVSNTGTCLDAPFHRFREGEDVSDLPLESLAALEGVLVRADGGARAIDVDAFRDVDVEGRAVLVGTGWSRHWRTDQYFEGHPFLTRAAAELLVAGGARLVGIDSLDIDDTEDGSRPVHTALLGSRIPIVEHLRGLECLRGRTFRFHAVPVKVRGFGTFPVRAFAELIGR